MHIQVESSLTASVARQKPDAVLTWTYHSTRGLAGANFYLELGTICGVIVQCLLDAGPRLRPIWLTKKLGPARWTTASQESLSKGAGAALSGWHTVNYFGSENSLLEHHARRRLPTSPHH
jgi:hypothetical protein